MQLNEMVVALGIPLGAFFMAVAIVGLVGYFKDQERRQRAELIKLALEKGQPLPPALLDRPAPARSDLASGIRTVFTGLGLSLFLWLFKPEAPLWSVGLLVVFVGIGQLVAHAAIGRKAPAPPGPSAG
jgi:hypothetical protein